MSTTKTNIKGALKAGRFSIPYRVYENEGPHIICINGIQQSMAMWHTFISRFSDKYRLTLFDFPHQGKAKVLSGPPQVTFEEQVAILKAVMQEAKVGKDAIMCAASWGGVIAVAFAAQYPQMIKRLILASLGTRPNQNMIKIIQAGTGMNISNREEMAEIIISSFGKNLPERIKQAIARQFRSMDEKDLRAFYEHGLFVISSKRLSELVNLKDIKAHTILLNGEKDTIIDLEDVKFLATQIPHCELRIIKDTGHFLHMEREEVLDIYEEILSSE
ncbi:MAG: alpha/beta hydrolase [Candidatus Omnitrophica bacterium]|nr:alpha/beta hydrolase [Candidatus Omnitrophota bacterium]